MIISWGRNYVFVHIPKTGGTSLAKALENRAMKDDILIGDTPKARRRKRRLKELSTRGRLWKHSTLADIDGILTPEDLAKMFTFTLVRNPWDRVVSYYHWLKSQEFEHPSIVLAKQMNFETFLQVPDIQKSLRNTPARTYMVDAFGVERCRCFIRLENLKSDLCMLEHHLGFALEVPHENASTRAKDFRPFYSRISREIVADICAEDIARFGYRFDNAK